MGGFRRLRCHWVNMSKKKKWILVVVVNIAITKMASLNSQVRVQFIQEIYLIIIIIVSMHLTKKINAAEKWSCIVK